MKDAQAMCELTASLVGCESSDVLVMSTGVIGRPLPMDQVREGIADAHSRLDEGLDSFLLAADAICTTDQFRKIVFREVLPAVSRPTGSPRWPREPE